MTEQQEEIWKAIPDYNGAYEVSSTGKVRSTKRKVLSTNGVEQVFKGRILSPDISKGYERVVLSRENKQKRYAVHRLVATCFVENELNYSCVNHVDGNKLNNSSINLSWCSYSENEKHSYDVLNKLNPIRKLKELDVEDIRNNAIKGVNTTYFMNKYDISRKTVLNVLNRKYYV